MKAQITILLAAALVCGTTVYFSQQQQTELASQQPPSDNGEIIAKLESIEERLGKLERNVKSPSPFAEPPTRSTDTAAVESTEYREAMADVSAQLDELSSRMQDQESRLDRAITPKRPTRKAPTAEAVADIQQQLRSAEEDEQKLKALRALRRMPKSLDPHTAVVDDIVAWLDQSDDAEVREDIIRQLHGAENPKLIEPLVHYLRFDDSESVREEAAETLDDYLDVATARAALEHAVATDPSEKVRAVATHSLAGGKRGR